MILKLNKCGDVEGDNYHCRFHVGNKLESDDVESDDVESDVGKRRQQR